MKKWLIGFFIVLVLLAAATYIFIPATLSISKIVFISTNQNVAYRLLAEENNWNKWWPGINRSNSPSAPAGNKSVHNYNGNSYSIAGKMINGVVISIADGDHLNRSSINIFSLGIDSVALEWKCEMVTGQNSVKKIFTYIKARKSRENMTDILDSLKRFLEIPEKVYGMRIEEKKVMDTILISTKAFTSVYPSPDVYYKLIKDLKDYVRMQGAKEMGYPMLHVRTVGIDQFEVMVAIPVNVILPGSNNIVFKRMVAGNILEAEIKGGTYRINEAYHQLETYVTDYNMSSPAIPFQSLVTDRLKETDTTKWVTRIYYPVF